MRATKAYIASLGTTGLLLAFSASLLVVVGTLFAFDAWPGAQVRDAVESVIVDDDDDAFQIAGPEQVALDAAPAAAAVALDPSGALGGADGGAAPGTGGGGGGGTGAPAPGGGGEQPGPGPGGGTGPGGGGEGPPGPGGGFETDDGTNRVADTTEQATKNLGDTVGGVSPEVGNTVTETGEALSEIVRDLPDLQVDQQGVSIGD